MPRPLNSNTRLHAGPAAAMAEKPATAQAAPGAAAAPLGDRALAGLRQRMVMQLAQSGITHEGVLAAMAQVPRHAFVDEALVSRAYENAALPIGAGQTISQPWIVARMVEAAVADRPPVRRVLEIGTGCGYQAAVLACLCEQVVSIERIAALHEAARQRLAGLPWQNIRLILGDGNSGSPGGAPYDAIVVAAAGLAIPDAWLRQLAVGGRLLAPEGGDQQRLILVERLSGERFRRTELEAVRFVPLQTGVQL